MIALTRSKFQDSGDVRRFKQRIVRENLVVRCARRQQVEHVLDADAQASNAGAPPTLLRVDRDAKKFFVPAPLVAPLGSLTQFARI